MTNYFKKYNNNKPKLYTALFLLVIAVSINAYFSFFTDNYAFALEDSTIKSIEGYFLSADYKSKAILKGTTNEDSPFITDITIEIYDNENNVAKIITPEINSGYSPDIIAADFGVEAGYEQIFYGASSGGSGGFGFYYVYSATNGKTIIFNAEIFDSNNLFTGNFINCYKAEIKKQGESTLYLIDLSNRPTDYKRELWDENGKLISDKKIDISGVNTVFPYYNIYSQNYQLMVYQRITGVNNADGLGYVITQQRYYNGNFETFYQGVMIFPS